MKRLIQILFAHVFLLGAGAPFAQQVTQFTGCLAPFTGALYNVQPGDTPLRGGCFRQHDVVRWSIEGPQGPEGPPGADGMQGPPGPPGDTTQLEADIAGAQAAASDAQARVGALEGKTTLSDLLGCNNGQVAKSNGAGMWSCQDDAGGGAGTDTLAALGCTEEGDTAVIFQGQWVCGSDLPRFVDNGDGTVTDRLTGLMWEQKTGTPGTNGSVCFSSAQCPDPHDRSNAYSWSDPGDGDETNPDGRLYTLFLASLNLDAVDFLPAGENPSETCFANHCDWRLPTIVELQTILLETCPKGQSPCVDEALFGPTTTSIYWSSTSVTSRPDLAWVVGNFNGDAVQTGKAGNWSVRAVRGGK